MPELSALIPWDKVTWDNVGAHSGAGHLDRRPYYFGVVGAGKGTKLLLISAVQSRTHVGSLHATDYLRLDHDGFVGLVELGRKVFGELPND